MASLSPTHILENKSGKEGGKKGSEALIQSTRSSLGPLLLAGYADISRISIVFGKEGKA